MPAGHEGLPCALYPSFFNSCDFLLNSLKLGGGVMEGDGVVNPFMWLPYLRRVCLYERAYSLLSLPPSGLGSSKLVCKATSDAKIFSTKWDISANCGYLRPHTPVFVWVGTDGAEEPFAPPPVFRFENSVPYTLTESFIRSGVPRNFVRRGFNKFS
jgi:hypothetical protein